MINSKGPTNSRIYSVAVYFRGERLAKAEGPSIQQAEMNAATLALTECSHLFPHLQHQRRILERSIMSQDLDTKRAVWEEEVRKVTLLYLYKIAGHFGLRYQAPSRPRVLEG